MRFKEHLLEALMLWLPLDGSLLVKLLWRLDLWASMRSFNGDFPPWRCSGRQRRRCERRRHPLRNKPWKKEIHHQDESWIRSLERMLQWRKRKRERKRESGVRMKEREGEKLNFEVCLIRLSFIKVATSVTHASIYSLGSFLKKLVLHPSNS